MAIPRFGERTNDLLCAIGSITGISGTVTIAATLDMQIQFIAYIIVMISSIVTLVWSLSVRNKWFLAMECGYLALAFLGLYTRYMAIAG